MKRLHNKCLPLLLAILLFAESTSFAGSKPASDAKTQAAAVGIGHKAVVTRSDGTEVKGTLTAIDADGFVLDRGKKTGTTQLAFTDVRQVRRDGMSGKEKGVVIAVSTVAVVGVGVVLAAIIVAKSPTCGSCAPGITCTCH